ncbi:MAG: hypothetical protein ACLTYN_05255 [Dysosmobacter welbionis]
MGPVVKLWDFLSQTPRIPCGAHPGGAGPVGYQHVRLTGIRGP